MGTPQDSPHREYRTISQEEADALVVENQGWAEGIAKSVARAWNMDWRGDGLDGAALEALLFCARRFQPDRGVPFRGYARKRIHEAATDAARKSRGWRKQSASSHESQARELSAELLNVFPELRSGELPFFDDGGDSDEGTRGAIRGLLMGATLLATRHDIDGQTPEDRVDQQKMVTIIITLELVHQWLLWKLYWEGLSMRGIATEWETDELNVIREHKILLSYLMKGFAKGKLPPIPKVRPGLRDVAQRLRRELGKEGEKGPFVRFQTEGNV